MATRDENVVDCVEQVHCVSSFASSRRDPDASLLGENVASVLGETVEEAERGESEGAPGAADVAPKAAPAGRLDPPVAKSRPSHYKVICISMYTRDLARLDALVDELKERGLTKANRSALIRVALEQLDLDKVPRGL